MRYTYVPHKANKPCLLWTKCKEILHKTISGVSLPCQELVNGELTQSFTLEDYKRGVIPGVYEYKYIVYVAGDEGGNLCENALENPHHLEFSFQLELQDPCESARIESHSTLPDVHHTVTDGMQRVSFSKLFSITPTFCNLDLRVELSALPRG